MQLSERAYIRSFNPGHKASVYHNHDKLVVLHTGKRRKPEVPILPYIPHPVCPNTGLPVKTNLPALCPEKVFGMGGLMLDPATAVEVPVLGVTIHPHTGQKLAVGGTYLNPLTGMLTPLEIGGPMTEPEGGKIVPILGVGLDSNTGRGMLLVVR